jgi:hypothetical protein
MGPKRKKDAPAPTRNKSAPDKNNVATKTKGPSASQSEPKANITAEDSTRNLRSGTRAGTMELESIDPLVPPYTPRGIQRVLLLIPGSDKEYYEYADILSLNLYPRTTRLFTGKSMNPNTKHEGVNLPVNAIGPKLGTWNVPRTVSAHIIPSSDVVEKRRKLYNTTLAHRRVRADVGVFDDVAHCIWNFTGDITYWPSEITETNERGEINKQTGIPEYKDLKTKKMTKVPIPQLGFVPGEFQRPRSENPPTIRFQLTEALRAWYDKIHNTFEEKVQKRWYRPWSRFSDYWIAPSSKNLNPDQSFHVMPDRFEFRPTTRTNPGPIKPPPSPDPLASRRNNLKNANPRTGSITPFGISDNMPWGIEEDDTWTYVDDYKWWDEWLGDYLTIPKAIETSTLPYVQPPDSFDLSPHVSFPSPVHWNWPKLPSTPTSPRWRLAHGLSEVSFLDLNPNMCRFWFACNSIDQSKSSQNDHYTET